MKRGILDSLKDSRTLSCSCLYSNYLMKPENKYILYKKVFFLLWLFFFSRPGSGLGQNITCTDSALTILYTSPSFNNSVLLANVSSISTRDNGTICWFGKSNTVNGNRVDSLVLFKVNINGQIVWEKIIDEGFTGYGYFWSITGAPQQALEMANGNILLFGTVDVYAQYGSPHPDFTILMLDSGGNKLWQKDYCGYGYTANAEGVNGDILLYDAQSGLLTRLDANGNMIWQYTYTPSSPGSNAVTAYYSNVYMINNQIYMEGRYKESVLNGNPVGMYMIKVDYQTGKILGCRSYQLNSLIPSADSINIENDWFTPVQNNSRFVFTCNLVNYYDGDNGQIEKGFLLLDTAFNILHPGLKISMTFPNSFIGGIIYLHDCGTNPSGITTCSFDDPNGNWQVGYYALIDTATTILSQRKLSFNTPQYPVDLEFKNNTILTEMAISGEGQSTPYFLFSRSYPDFISGNDCNGMDTVFLNSAPFNPVASGVQFTQTAGGTLTQTVVQTAGNDFVVNAESTCTQGSTCDSLKINGPAEFCLSDSVLTYTATKNVLCYKRTSWLADSNFVSVAGLPDDTTVLLKFKNNWKGYLYAQIAGCGITDSLKITVHSPQQVDIGKDTTLCPGSKITIDAGSGFAGYLWQDGSTDSIFAVSSPGEYYITATDECNITSSDTILVTYVNMQLDAGPDLELCEKQNSRLSANDGFTNYLWQPAEGIVGGPAAQSIEIDPSATTDYIVTATAEGICLLSDTVKVVVDNCLNKLVVPMAFAPDHGGVNDVLRPVVFGYLAKYEFFIYNRWGQLVFHSNQPGLGWDGTIDGRAQGEGTFVWYCHYQFSGDIERTGKGTFLLIR